jgi:hypothetical protein
MEEKTIGAVSADDFAARSFRIAGCGSKSAAGRIPTRLDAAPLQMLASLIIAHPRDASERETLDVSFLSGFD